MKIKCWEDLDNIRLTKFGNFRNIKTNETLSYMDSCKTCGHPYFTIKKKPGEFCDYSCVAKSRKFTKKTKEKLSKINSGKNNPNYGNKWNKEQKLKQSIRIKGKYSGENNPMYGVIRNGENNPNWKGGYHIKNIPIYDVYAYKINFIEEVRRNPEDENVLQVKCKHCEEWHTPTIFSVNNRIRGLYGNKRAGENNFYCSQECKQLCPIYNKKNISRRSSK